MNPKKKCHQCNIEKAPERFIMTKEGKEIESRYCDDCRTAFGLQKKSDAHKNVRKLATTLYNGDRLESIEQARKLIHRASVLSERFAEMLEEVQQLAIDLESLCPWIDELREQEKNPPDKP